MKKYGITTQKADEYHQQYGYNETVKIRQKFIHLVLKRLIGCKQ